MSQDDGPIYVTPKTSRPERAQDLLWTIYTSDDLIDALSFIKRSQGAQKPFWSPTFMADLTLSAAQVGSQQLDVLAGRMVDSQLLLRPDAAIAVQRPGETMQLAAVTGISTLSASVRRLTLDRQVFNGLSLPATTKISLVYRTRFTGDSFSIQYLTGKLVELKINVTTAQVLTNGS